MTNYNFKSIYPDDITYNHPNYIFNFFTTQEQTAEFFKFLFFNIKNEYEKYLKGEKDYVDVVKNNNDSYPLIDINYNFFIKVLGEWIEHYSHKKESLVEYRKFLAVEVESEEIGAEKEKIIKYRDVKLTLSISEHVRLDFSNSDWMMEDKYKKRNRYLLVQIMFNNVLGSFTYVSGFKYMKIAKPVVIDLVKNKNGKLFGINTILFMRKNLSSILEKQEMKLLHKISEEMTVEAAGILEAKQYKKKNKITDKDINYCDSFNASKIEETRDKNDGKYHNFSK